MLPLVPKGNNTLIKCKTAYNVWSCNHSSNLFSLTLVYVHTDGAECLFIALEKYPHLRPMGFFLQRYIAFS